MEQTLYHITMVSYQERRLLFKDQLHLQSKLTIPPVLSYIRDHYTAFPSTSMANRWLMLRQAW